MEEINLRDLGVTTVVFLLGATTVVTRVIERYLERRAERRIGGQVIDLRPGQVLVRRDLNLRADLLLVVTADGEIEIKAVDGGDDLRQLYTSVIRAVLATGNGDAGQMADAIATAVGDRAAVTSRPQDS